MCAAMKKKRKAVTKDGTINKDETYGRILSDKVREESKKINGCGFYSHHAAPWTKDLLCWVKGVASLL